MFKNLTRSILCSFLCLASVLLMGAVPFPANPPAAPEQQSISPRNRFYGDPEALEKLKSEANADPAFAKRPEVQKDPEYSYYQPGPRIGTTLVFSLFSGYSGRASLYKQEGYYINKAFDNIQFFDGGMDSYSPDLNPKISTVVFTSYTTEQNADIYTVSLDGSSLKRLVDHPAYDGTPVWSPDGSRIAFVSKRDGNSEIYTMLADGSQQKRLTYAGESDFSPTWSPDGKSIAWIKAVSEKEGQIWKMNADGSGQQSASAPLRYLSDLVWSPDGNRFGYDYDIYGYGTNTAYVTQSYGDFPINVSSDLTGCYIDFTFSSWAYDQKTMIVLATAFDCEGKYTGSSVIEVYEDHYFSGLNIFTTGNTELVTGIKARFTDPNPPTVQFSQLPLFSRLYNVPITFTVQDKGTAGLMSYYIYARNITDPYANWSHTFYREEPNNHSPITVQSTFYGYEYDTITAPSKVSVTASDWAGNKMTSPEQSTTLFSSLARVGIFDNRGIPYAKMKVQDAAAVNQQDFSRSDGYATLYYSYNAVWSSAILSGDPAAGQSLTTKRHSGYIDEDFHLVLAPTDQLVLNGGFEATAPLESWITSGAAGYSDEGNSGKQSARLGSPCANPFCLSNPDSNAPVAANKKQVTVDSHGNLHLINNGMYWMRDAKTAAWSGPQVLFSQSQNSAVLRMDENDTLHLIYNQSIYLYKPEGGNWSQPISNPGLIDFAVDPIGNLVGTNGSIIFKRSAATGSWTNLQPPKAAKYVSLDATKNGSLYVKDENNSTGCAIIQLSYAINGMISEACPPDSINYNSNLFSLAVDDQGNMHFFQTDPYESKLYWYKPAGGSWSAAQLVRTNWRDYIFTGPNGLLLVKNSNATYTRFITRYPTTGSFNAVTSNQFANQTLDGEFAIFDPSGHLYTYGSKSRSGAVNANDASAFMQQQINLPAGMHKPTLSFMVRLDGSFDGAADAFKVEIIPAGGTPVTVFQKGSIREGWRHQWVDLSPWAGQTVTVRFSLTQTKGSPQLVADIDDVSVGSWTTPIIKSVSPNLLIQPFPPSTVITIKGENFMGYPSTLPIVKLNGQSIPVTWVDENTLQFSIASNFPTGVYDLEVINPSGAHGYLEKALSLKPVQVFVPAVQR